ncbi:hypothetical protein [Kitasatospora purpeofusca]
MLCILIGATNDPAAVRQLREATLDAGLLPLIIAPHRRPAVRRPAAQRT